MIEMIGFFSRYAAFTLRQSLATALCDQGKDEESSLTSNRHPASTPHGELVEP
jgi:hypothetical protein